jgi:formylglycine-generating enzyme required for sulfatase activity
MAHVSLSSFLAEGVIVWHLCCMRIWGIIGVIGAVTLGASARAQSFTDPNSGIEFVTVGAVNNPAWTGANSYNNGRGSVGYTYNIGKFEVTTTQWVEFLNAAFDRPSNDQIPHVIRPSVFSGFAVPGNNGGVRWTVPAGTEMRGVGGITWRTAAVYCNWLHNGKSTDRTAFLSGAYDVSTFGNVQGVGYTDQLTRSEGARYWIPSLDEWLKAAHYDPNKANADGSVGGWWTYSNGTDTPLRYAPPGLFDPQGNPSQANASFVGPSNPYLIPLGSYPDTTSPFGLLDVAGMTREWTEEPRIVLGVVTGKVTEGSAWAVYAGADGLMDHVAVNSAVRDPGTADGSFGFRIASSVPTPGACFVGVIALTYSTRRRRT